MHTARKRDQVAEAYQPSYVTGGGVCCGVGCTPQGYNATVLAYGQTGSGKTHTMSGGTGIHGIKEQGEGGGKWGGWGEGGGGRRATREEGRGEGGERLGCSDRVAQKQGVQMDAGARRVEESHCGQEAGQQRQAVVTRTKSAKQGDGMASLPE
jgi:hypothetical protein